MVLKYARNAINCHVTLSVVSKAWATSFELQSES